MAANRFDLLTQSLIAPSRRGFSRALAGLGIMGGLSSLLRTADGEAKKRKKKKKKCKGETKKCGKKCILKTECCGGCGEERQCCDGICADLSTDGANCGACGHACATNACIHGACTCNDDADCCITCITRVEGGKACAFFISFDSCDTDADCPLGSVCVDNGIGLLVCTDPCPA